MVLFSYRAKGVDGERFPISRNHGARIDISE
jgi:hypothetical protein